MATDSTELTFVRCPSCRSLVPAASTRCRMCGAALDSSQKANDADADAKKSGRVRQRTMSQPDSEVAAAVERVRQEENSGFQIGVSEPLSEEIEKEEEKPVELKHEVPSVDDPLSAYIEEVEVGEESEIKEEALTSSSSENVEERKEKIPETEESKHSETSPKVEPEEALSREENSRLEEKVEVDVKQSQEENKSSVNSEEPPVQPIEAKPIENRARVVVESGSRRMNKGHGLSFGKGRDERPQFGGRKDEATARGTFSQAQHKAGQPNKPEFPAPERKPETRELVKPVKTGFVASTNKMERREEPSDNSRKGMASVSGETSAKSSGTRLEGNQQVESRVSEQVKGSPAPAINVQKVSKGEIMSKGSESTPVSVSGGVKPVEAKSGKLMGWFVSYADPRGISSEFREGRFFVSRASLKQSDMILDHESVSIPHALVSVTQSEGMRIQDLMSESGVFLKRKGDGEFQRVSDVVKIEHGDSVKFGEQEFLVCLVFG